MKFQLRATAEKQLWTNDESYMYAISESDSNRTKKWTIFTRESLCLGQVYDFAGTVSESKDKKTKDANGRDIWKVNFNADIIKGAETMETFDPNSEPNFNESDEIPF